MSVKPITVGVLLVAAAAAGAAAYLYFQRREPQAELPGQDLQAPVAKLAATLPDFKLADRDGQMRSLADWPDKALIVNFWATWCSPCRREIPLLLDLQRRHGPDGFLVGIAVDFRDKVLAYADEMKIDYPLLIGEQEALDAAAAFGVEAVGFPFTVFSDRHGRIVTAHLGELTAAQADLILGTVRRVNAGDLGPIEARAVIDAALRELPKPPAED